MMVAFDFYKKKTSSRIFASIKRMLIEFAWKTIQSLKHHDLPNYSETEVYWHLHRSLHHTVKKKHSFLFIFL